jgi:hypothetical protein
MSIHKNNQYNQHKDLKDKHQHLELEIIRNFCRFKMQLKERGRNMIELI